MQPDRPLAIEAHGVGKRHGRQWVLRHLDLDIPAGSSMVLLGANGSGKSSLLALVHACARDGRLPLGLRVTSSDSTFKGPVHDAGQLP